MATKISKRAVLRKVLFDTLKRNPNGLSVPEVYKDINANYSFQPQWYLYIPRGSKDLLFKKLGTRDWRQINQSVLQNTVATEIMWQNRLRWSRNDLVDLGVLDPAKKGIWKLNGSQMPDTEASFEFTPEEKKVVTRKASSPARSLPAREKLLKELSMIGEELSTENLRLFVNLGYTILKTR